MKKLKCFVSYMIRFHCKREDVLSMKEETVGKKFLDSFASVIYKTLNNFDDSEEIEIRLLFYRFFSKFWNLSGGLCSKRFFYVMDERWPK